MKTTQTEATLTYATETPWHVGIKPGPMVYGKWGEQIADCQSVSLDRNEAGHNALLICKAVNSHDALVRALNLMNQSLTGGYCCCPMQDGQELDCNHSTPCQEARAALQLVKGGE